MEMLHIRLPKEVHKELKLCAVSKGQSMTALIGDLIEQYLKIKKEAA
jgi:predicted HicB family RNase H-like nuclease